MHIITWLNTDVHNSIIQHHTTLLRTGGKNVTVVERCQMNSLKANNSIHISQGSYLIHACRPLQNAVMIF